MASHKLVFSVLLLTVFIAVAAATEPEDCRVGKAISYKVLPSCEQYIRRRCTVQDNPGQVPIDLKAQCCDELAKLPAMCRCDALSIMVYGVITEEGTPVGRMETVPGCDRKKIADMAVELTHFRQCNLNVDPYRSQDCPMFKGGMN